MKKVENSVLYWGIYVIVLGLALIVFPVATVALFWFDSQGELWIRLTGVLSVVLGLFYLQVARYRIVVLYKWKIIGHLFGLMCMITFLSSGIADQRIIGTLIIEFLGCAWTLITLRMSNQELGMSNE